MAIITIICKFGHEAVAIPFDIGSSFEEFIFMVRNTWNVSTEWPTEITYCIPGYDKCFVRTRDEFTGFLHIVDAYKLKVVHMELKVHSYEGVSQERTHDERYMICGATDGSPFRASASKSCLSIGSNSTAIGSLIKPLLSSGWKHYIVGAGQQFPGSNIEFRAALVKYSIERGFIFYYAKNTGENVLAYCKYREADAKCQWMVSASINPVTHHFEIKKLNQVHCCNATLNMEKSKRLSSKLVAGLITDCIRDDKVNWTPNKVVVHLQKSYGLEISYDKAYHALNKANKQLFGNDVESYQQLIWYTRAAVIYNPESHILLEVSRDDDMFKRVFVAWGPCVLGFRYVRPILFLDGTHLKGKYKGCLLSATGKNGNQELYPLAYAVVDAESKANWIWYLTVLSQALDGRQVTFVSDRNPGLLEALELIFPDSPHYYCLQHLKDNLRSRYCGIRMKRTKERVVKLLDDCAKAPTIYDFEVSRDMFETEGGDEATEFIEGLPLHKWTNAYGVGQRYGELTSNTAESFNSWIGECRSMPITQMVDALRTKLMVWFNERKTKADKCTGLLTEEWEEKMNELSEKGRTWNYKQAGPYIFEVFSQLTELVDLQEKTCSCSAWQLTGFPCAHAILCINRTQLLMEDYIDHYFHADFYRKSYGIPIHPIPTAVRNSYERDDDQQVHPPKTKRPPGRPRKSRFKTKGELSLKKLVRCSRCKQLGHHNKKSCKAPI